MTWGTILLKDEVPIRIQLFDQQNQGFLHDFDVLHAVDSSIDEMQFTKSFAAHTAPYHQAVRGFHLQVNEIWVKSLAIFSGQHICGDHNSSRTEANS